MDDRYPDTQAQRREDAMRVRYLRRQRRERRRRRLRRLIRDTIGLVSCAAVLMALGPWALRQAEAFKAEHSVGRFPLFAGDTAAGPWAGSGTGSRSGDGGIGGGDAPIGEDEALPPDDPLPEEDGGPLGPDDPGDPDDPNDPNDPNDPGGPDARTAEEDRQEQDQEQDQDGPSGPLVVWPPRYAPEEEAFEGFAMSEDEGTFHLSQDLEQSAIKSLYAVLIDAQTGEILAERSSDARISPASMTKVLTLLTAVEAVQAGDAHPDGVTGWGRGMDGVAVIDQPIRDYCWSNQCSVAGFERYERIPVKDLFYGCILPSGADACLALANYVSGSHGAFVERMNEKLAELGLADEAHFSNCVGLYAEDHNCTVKAMAAIMEAAMSNDLCREVLGTRIYQTSATEQHPSGIYLTNLFIRRIEDRFTDTPLKVIGAKTGYVRQSGNCAVSFARRSDGREYICVTGMGWGSWGVIGDHTALYQTFCMG